MNELQLLSLGYLVFAVSIGLEMAWSRLRHDGGYRLSQFVVNIGHGMLFQVADGFTKALVLLPLVVVGSLGTPKLPLDTVWAWVLGFVLYDLSTYWRHRHHHEVGVLWCIHGVHHAAEDFNLAAALRQALFQNVVAWLWFVPVALVLPFEMLVGLIVIDYLYQFFQHTRYVGKLGPIELVFNTPSHHRVHHGTEPHYLDKNYGGMLIVWDRLFSTFQEEGEEPTYGLTRPMRTLDPLWGNLVLWFDLARAVRHTPDTGARLRMLFGPPVHMETRLKELEDDGIDWTPPEIPVLGVLAFLGATGLLAVLAWVPPDAWPARIGLAVIIVVCARPMTWPRWRPGPRRPPVTPPA